jgi:hypothetical protein
MKPLSKPVSFLLLMVLLASSLVIPGVQAATTDIAVGNNYAFDAEAIAYQDICHLDSTHFAISFQDVSDKTGCVVVGEVSGNTITYGPKLVAVASSSTYTHILSLSSTRFVAFFTRYWDPGTPYALVCDVNGTTVTKGSEYAIPSVGSAYGYDAVALNSSTFCVAVSQSSTWTNLAQGSISGTTITWGTTSTGVAVNSDYIGLVQLTPQKLVQIYTNTYVYARVVTLTSGDLSTYTYGTTAQFSVDSNPTYLGCDRLNTTAFVVSSGLSYNIKVGTVSGTTITFGAVTSIGVNTGYYQGLDATDDGRIVFGYYDYPSTKNGYVVCGTVTGTSIALEAPTAFVTTHPRDIRIACLSNTKFIMSHYEETGGAGKATVGNIPVLTIPRWKPTITSTPATTVELGNEYTYTPTTNESVSWEISSDIHFQFAYNQGMFFVVESKPVGSYWVSLKATSTAGTLAIWQNWTVTVEDSTPIPAFANMPDTNASKRVWYSWTPSVTPDCTFALNTTAGFLTINQYTGQVIGIPTSAGTYHVMITATSTEYGTSAMLSYNLTVADYVAPPDTNDGTTDSGGSNGGTGNTGSVIAAIPDRYLVTGLVILAILVIAIAATSRRH